MEVRQRGGYIKMYRSLLDWEWYKDNATFRLWVHLLLKVNWDEGRFMGEVIPPGSLVTSYRHLADETGLSVRAVRTALKHLKSTHEVTHRVTSKFSVITIEKWDVFQSEEFRIDTLVDKVTDKQVTSNRQASDKQVTTIEEYKNIRNKIYLNNGGEKAGPFGESLPPERMESIVRKITAMQGADDG